MTTALNRWLKTLIARGRRWLHQESQPPPKPIGHRAGKRTKSRSRRSMSTSLFAEFEIKNQIIFHDKTLLRQAFTHRSYLNEQQGEDVATDDNERLEFLGDAVLGFLISEMLYLRFPERDEGELTQLRASLVRRESLARHANAMGIGPVLLLGVGEVEGGARTRLATLCDAFEALIGAYYLDRGLDAVRAAFLPRFEAGLPAQQVAGLAKDAKSRMQEWAQSTTGYTPRYRVVDSSGPDHAKIFFTVVTVHNTTHGVGRGASKQDASQAAAAMALYRAGEPAPEYTYDPDLEKKYGFDGGAGPTSAG